MQSIGERLEEARKKKGISLREAAEATKIRGDYLQQFENNRFDINLTEIYVRGFLRGYATYLKLPVEKLLNDYASLGRGEARPRQPSREIYGRMDVSVTSADDRGDASEEAPSPQPPRRHPAVTRGNGPVAEPAIDPALLFKLGKWAAIILVVVLLFLGGKAIMNSGAPATVAHTSTSGAVRPPATQPVVEKTVTLVALDTVRVFVTRKNNDGSEGEEIFRGTLVRGQKEIVSWSSAIYIHANAGENLEIEYKGKRYSSMFTGTGRAQM